MPPKKVQKRAKYSSNKSMRTFKSAQKSAKKSAFTNKSAQKSSSAPICVGRSMVSDHWSPILLHLNGHQSLLYDCDDIVLEDDN